MPTLTQGDIFEAARRSQLTVVFGHFGFNQLNIRWKEFAKTCTTLYFHQNSLTEQPNTPIAIADKQFLWFVPANQNQGMSDDEMRQALDKTIDWALEMKLNTIATNGIADIDHGHDTQANRESDDRRARVLIEYAKGKEDQFNINIELVSLNDVFVRL